MKKNKKNKPLKLPIQVPAYDRFCVYEVEIEHYEWQGWGLVIRHLRDFTGMDQAIFGRLLQGYKRGQIARYETEQTEPPIDFWVKMMQAFGLNINWALTGQGEPYILEYQDSQERKRFYKWVQLITDKDDFLKELKGW